jgi:hypothetical protein
MQNCNEKPTHAPTNAASIAKIWTATVTVRPSFRGGLQRGCARDRAIGERTNDQTCYRPRAVFLHVCVRHWHRDRCRKLAHLKRGASAGRLYAVVPKPTPNFTRLDPSRLEISILVDAMLRAREVVASRSWSSSPCPFTLDGNNARAVTDNASTRTIERFGDIVAYPILGGLHHCLRANLSFRKRR